MRKLNRFTFTVILAVLRVPYRLIVGKSKRDAFFLRLPLYYWLIDHRYILFDASKENYDAMYGQPDYRNKVVLDIGADYGSTASFFFSKGAKRVVAVEPNVSRFRILAEWQSRRLQARCIRIQAPTDIAPFMVKDFIDIAKFDCEGCEKHLLGVDDEALRCIGEYVMELHPWFLNPYSIEDFVAKFERCGYTVSLKPECDGRTVILHAVRG